MLAPGPPILDPTGMVIDEVQDYLRALPGSGAGGKKYAATIAVRGVYKGDGAPTVVIVRNGGRLSTPGPGLQTVRWIARCYGLSERLATDLAMDVMGAIHDRGPRVRAGATGHAIFRSIAAGQSTPGTAERGATLAGGIDPGTGFALESVPIEAIARMYAPG